MNVKERAKGAFMGALIGEALGVGPHWYYDLAELTKDYGAWIDDYTTPKKGRYHEGLEAGDISQQGFIMVEMAKYLIREQGYQKETFTKMMDDYILPYVDGKPMGGVGGYTSQMMRELYVSRMIQQKPWGDIATISDTTESLERNIPTAIFYLKDLNRLSHVVAENTALTQSDNITGSMTVAYHLVLAMLILGEPLDEHLSQKLMKKVYRHELPFYHVTSENLGLPKKGEGYRLNKGLFASPDALLSPSYMAQAAKDTSIYIEPASKVSLIYGMPCAIYHVLPAVYYLSARFKNNFEDGILHAINGGGQNQIRAMLTGALIGAQVGLEGIPKRFIEKLKNHQEFLMISEALIQHIE